MVALNRSAWLPFFLLIWLALPVRAEAPMRLPVDPSPLSIVDADGKQKVAFSVEIARTPDQHRRGLMFRTDLPADRAMLFVFADEDQRAFWMQNTPTPLDIVYADRNGLIRSIAEHTVPFSTQPIPSGWPTQHVLEFHAGTAGLLGIVPGDVMRHPEIAPFGSN